MNEPVADMTESTARRPRALAVAVLTLIMLTSYHGVIPVFAERICGVFSLSKEQYGTMLGVAGFGNIAALLLVGLMISRFGVRRITECALIGIGGCFACIGLGASLVSLKYSLPFHGLFAGLAQVAFPAYLIALYPALKRRMISTQYVIVSVGGIVVPLCANQLLKWSEGGDDRAFASVFFGPFLIVGCILVVGGTLLALSRQPQLQGQQTTRETFDIRHVFGFRELIVVLLVALHASADSTIYQFLPLFMPHHFNELPLAPAWALVGHNIAYLITRFLLSLLPEGMGQRQILTLAGPIGGLILLAMLWQGSAVSVPLLYMLASLFYAAEFPVLLSEISFRSMGHGPVSRFRA